MHPLFGPKTQLWFSCIALLIQPLNASAVLVQVWPMKWAVLIAAGVGGLSNVMQLLARFGTPSSPSTPAR